MRYLKLFWLILFPPDFPPPGGYRDQFKHSEEERGRKW
jgi:hypothetical protein